MLYQIKVLKAPWPECAKVGDVIDMPFLPIWAEGKCSVAPDGAEATLQYEPRKPAPAAATADAGAAAGMASAQQYLDDMRTAHAREVAELHQTIADGSQALAEVTAERDSLLERLTAADTDDGKAAAALKLAEEQAVAERAAAAEKAGAKGGKKA